MNIINKIIDYINNKRIGLLAAVGLFISMLPNWFLAFIARPSGDDYGYSALSRQTWLETGSFIEVVKAGLETTKSMCSVWNGDWFSVFIFTLMPEVFITKSFWIIPLFWSFAVIGATYYVIKEIFCNYLGFKWYEAMGVSSLILLMYYQWIPSSSIGLYWYVGVIHYIMPHVIALLLITFFLKYVRLGRKRYIIYSIGGMVAIGGSSYYSFFLVFFVYILLFLIFYNKRKEIYGFILPLCAGIIALYFQITAPGNSARVESTLTFGLERVIQTIWDSLLLGFNRIIEYTETKRIMLIILAFLALFVWRILEKYEENIKFRYPILWIIYMYGIYASMFTPEIYAGTEVSLGPATMEYLTFLLCATSSIVYLEGWIISKYGEKIRKKMENRMNHLTLVFSLICLLSVFCLRGDLKNTLFYDSVHYIISGQAADYKKQMDSQLEILLDASIREAYLCPTNDEQGPLMHMPVINDPDAFTNWAVKQFYGKDLVITTE